MAVATTAGRPVSMACRTRGDEVGEGLAGAGSGLDEQVLAGVDRLSRRAWAISTCPGRSVPPTPATAAWRRSSSEGTRAGYAAGPGRGGIPSTARQCHDGGVSLNDESAPPPAAFPTDLEIATAATLRPLGDVAASMGLTEADIEPYGRDVAKLDLSLLHAAWPAAPRAATSSSPR